MNKIDLNGRTAVVTGGAQGFGKAITERFVASGAKVAIWDHDKALQEARAHGMSRIERAMREYILRFEPPPQAASDSTKSDLKPPSAAVH